MKTFLSLSIFLLIILIPPSKIKIGFLNKTMAEESEKNNLSEVKTDLDDLKYDFSETEIEEFIEQYERLKKIKNNKTITLDNISEIEDKIKEMKNNLSSLQKLFIRLEKKFSSKVTAEDHKIDHIIKTYESMKPLEVSDLLLKHKTEILVRFIDGMKVAAGGKIFSEMLTINPQKVISAAEIYTGFNTRYTKELREKDFNAYYSSLDEEEPSSLDPPLLE